MPITYTLDHDRNLIRTSCTGYTTFGEVIGHFAALRQLPSLPEPLHVYLDLTDLASLPSTEQLQAVAETAGSLESDVRWGALAIVVDMDVVFGTGRMFEAFVERFFQRVKVFRDPAAAEAWLDEGP